MAGLRKSRRSGGNTGSVLLICFLIFFVLATFVLGGMFWQQLDVVEKAKSAATTAIKEKETLISSRVSAKVLAYHARRTVGKLELDEDEKNEYDPRIAMFLRREIEDKKFQKMFDDMHEILDKDLQWDDKEVKFKKSYHERLADETKEVAKWTKSFLEEKKKFDGTDRFQTNLKQTHLTKLEDLSKAINDAAKQEFKEAGKQNEAFAKMQAVVAMLKADEEKSHKDFAEKLQKREGELSATIANLEIAIKDLRNRVDERGGGNAGVTRTGSQPLALEIGTGRTLWDHPHGSIVAIDPEKRRVTISIGKNSGVKPELTFNVFPNQGGKPHGLLRGTLEVQSVNDDSSVCQITSMYDLAGHEILFNDATLGRLDRESSNAFQKGDLLFNPFFNARVAIAGALQLNGKSYSADEQNRQIQHFNKLMTSYNVVVDAYVDLNTGERNGNLQPETRFLIRGADAMAAKPAAAGEADRGEAMGRPDDERLEKVQKAIDKMRAEAGERGMLIVSAENFAFMVGYRTPKAGYETNNLALRPRPPQYFSGKSNVVAVQKGGAPVGPAILGNNDPVVPAVPAMEKKDAEAEKKDAN